ncbi:hypothetical protein ACOMHN_062612 [Nucella lapillus]
MGIGRLSLLLMLFAHTAYSDYVALAPANFWPGREYRVQLTVVNTLNGQNVNIVGNILSSKGSSVASSSAILTNGETDQLRFQVPILSSAEGSSYTLKLDGSGGLTFTNSTPITLESQTMVTLVQTDKSIYKALDTVRIRVITVDSDLKPEKMKRTITIKNPAGSSVKRYIDDGSKVVFEDTFELVEFPDMGDWKIEVESKERNMKTDSPFKVDEYVLPKFEVTVMASPLILLKDSGITRVKVQVKALYTYGKGVLGDIELTVGKQLYTETITALTGIQDVEIDVAEEVKRGLGEILVLVNVTDATKRTYGTTVKLQVRHEPVVIEFDKDRSDQVYRPGTTVEVVLKVTDATGVALPAADGGKKPLTLTLTDSSSKSNTQTETLALGNGMKYFSWTLRNIMSTADNLDIRADLMYKGKKYTSYFSLQRYRTVGNATLNARWTSSSMEMWSKATFAVDVYQANDFDRSTIRYMIVSRGNVVDNRNVDLLTNEVDLTPALCPKADIIVYGLTKVTVTSPKPEVIADRLKLDLKGCQTKQVKTEGPDGNQRTGSKLNLTVSVSWTEPNKNDVIGEHEVFFLAVDKSLTLLQEENPDLTPEKMDKALGPFRLAEDNSGSGGQPIPFGDRGKRSIWPGPGFGSGPTSTGELLKNVGLTLLSDTVWEKEYKYPIMVAFDDAPDMAMAMPMPRANMPIMESASANVVPKLQTQADITTVRKNFPDTWIWSSAKTNTKGQATLEKKLPDSITSWVVSAFAIRDNSEVAVTFNPDEVVAFNPFFLDLNLPYSIRRGEKFTLQVTAFNYESADMSCTVTLLKPQDAGFEIVGETSHAIMVEKDVGQSVKFIIDANTITTINLTVTAMAKTKDNRGVNYTDTVTRTLIVKPEGKERKRTETMAVILTADQTVVEKEIEFAYEKDLVAGSERSDVRVTGDLMSNMLGNIENLVTQPTGCGEQNMITTVLNIYAMSYLVSVGETTTKFNTTAKKFMTEGYNRETQMYRFKDTGGYSAFGVSDGNASTWLTAFVVRSFAQAKPYIPSVVDEDVLKMDMTFLLSNQRPDGTFGENGRVIHDEMKGGTGAEDGALSVYVTLCLLEANSRVIDVSSEKLARSVAFVKTVGQKLVDRAKTGADMKKNMYLAALTAYTLSLAKPLDQLLVNNVLKIVADSDMAPWKMTPPATPTPGLLRYHPPAGPSAVETTSYVIMAYINLRDLAKAQTPTPWLQTQQNSQGGYSSTQDTVIALQATSEFAAKANSFGAKSSIIITTLQPSGGETYNMTIDNSNRSLLQSQIFSDDVRKVKVRVVGEPNSLTLVKINWYYYTSPQVGSPDLTIDTKVIPAGPNQHQINTCFSLGPGFTYDNMMLMTVENPSGLTEDSLVDLRKENTVVKRAEVRDNKLNLYFSSAEKDQCVKYKIRQENEVENRQPGNVVFYAYYKPDEIRAEAKFEITCTENCEITPTPTPTDHASPMVVSGLLLTACLCLLLSLIVAV